MSQKQGETLSHLSWKGHCKTNKTNGWNCTDTIEVCEAPLGTLNCELTPPHCLHLALLPLPHSYWSPSSYSLINSPPSRSEMVYFSPQFPGFRQTLEATGHITVKCGEK